MHAVVDEKWLAHIYSRFQNGQAVFEQLISSHESRFINQSGHPGFARGLWTYTSENDGSSVCLMLQLQL